MFFPYCLLPGCRVPSELPPSEDMTHATATGVQGARRVHCAPPAYGVWGQKLVLHHFCCCLRAQGGWYISACANSSCPRCRAAARATTEDTGAESGTFVHPWKFRSPVVLQHSDIIVASILRIASSRNVGGSGFSSLLVLTLHLQTQFLSFCKVRHFFYSCVIIENCHRVSVVLKWRQMKVHLFPEWRQYLLFQTFMDDICSPVHLF